MRPRPIGIVGCSAEGAALCYRTICTEAPARLGGHAHPEIALHTLSLQAYVDALEAGELEMVAALMLRSAEALARAGAEILICPDNTIHAAMPLVRENAPVPFLHIAEVVADEAAALGLSRLALLGTRWLVESDVYPAALEPRGVSLALPADEDRQLVDRIIMDELVRGVFREESTAALLAVVARMAAEGCDGALLGCTELPLVMNGGNSPLPLVDSTRLLARAALAASLGEGVAGSWPGDHCADASPGAM